MGEFIAFLGTIFNGLEGLAFFFSKSYRSQKLKEWRALGTGFLVLHIGFLILEALFVLFIVGGIFYLIFTAF